MCYVFVMLSVELWGLMVTPLVYIFNILQKKVIQFYFAIYVCNIVCDIVCGWSPIFEYPTHFLVTVKIRWYDNRIYWLFDLKWWGGRITASFASTLYKWLLYPSIYMKKSTKNILIGLGSIIVIFTVSYFKTRKMQSLHTENKDEDDE